MNDQERKAMVRKIWEDTRKMKSVPRAYVAGLAEGIFMTTALQEKEKEEKDGRDAEEDRAELSGAGLDTV